MPACASCAQELPRARFSQKQLHKPANVRRCLGCTSALRHAAIAPLANDDDDVLRLMGKALDAMARPKLASAQQAMRGLRRATTFRDASEFLVAHMEGSDDAELLVAVAREIVSAATEEWRNTGLLIGLIELMEDLAIVTRNRIPLPEEGSFELLVDVLKRHPDNAAVVKAVASTLSLNAEDAHDAAALFELGATAHLVRALHDHVQAADVSAVVVKALELLIKLRGVSSGQHAALFIAMDKLSEALVDAMIVHRADALVQELCVNALAHLYLDHGAVRAELANNEVKVVDKHFAAALLGIVKWHSALDAALATAVGLLGALAAVSPRSRGVFIQQGAVGALKSVRARNAAAVDAALRLLE